MRRAALAVAAGLAVAAPGRAHADDPVGSPPAAPAPSVSADATTFDLHGYARMPLAFQGTPREPYLVDSDYFLSGFAYTRLQEPDWAELFFGASRGDYSVKFGIFSSLFSDYATTELENQTGIAQASVGARRFLGVAPLSVELGVFWDQFGHVDPYDTYLFGRTHQGGFKLRYQLGPRAYLQAGAGAHQAIPQRNQGMTPIAHVVGGLAVGPVQLDGYFLYTWTRDKPKLSPIKDGGLLVLGVDATVPTGRFGPVYAALAYYAADQAVFLAPSVELLHSAGGRGLAENFLGISDSMDGTGSIITTAVDWPAHVLRHFDVRAFGMLTYVRSEQKSDLPSMNKDRRMYLKWGLEPAYELRPGIVASVRFDRVILDMEDQANSFRVISPRVRFPLSNWGELLIQYSRYFYGDKVQLRPGQVPLETTPDEQTFKVQAQARW